MHMQGMLRKQQGLPSPNKQKRKRSAPLPPAQHVEALTCTRHIDAAAEVLCVDCVELSCIRCAFECAQG
jgi:hypothetical protein